MSKQLEEKLISKKIIEVVNEEPSGPMSSKDWIEGREPRKAIKGLTIEETEELMIKLNGIFKGGVTFRNPDRMIPAIENYRESFLEEYREAN